MSRLQSRPLFTLSITLHPTIDIGSTPAGGRRIFPVSGGKFEGERICGEVSPYAGSDYLLARSDGTFQQDARLLLQASNGDVIAMTYRGVRRASADVDRRLTSGEDVPADEYYLRIVPFFETASSEHGWLNGIVSVGLGARRSGGVVYELHEIL